MSHRETSVLYFQEINDRRKVTCDREDEIVLITSSVVWFSVGDGAM